MIMNLLLGDEQVLSFDQNEILRENKSSTVNYIQQE